MKLTKHDPQTEMKLNATPMIDVVFLLIVFFMVITDLTQSDLEELKLPVARTAVPDEPEPGVVRPVANVLQGGEVVVRQEVLSDPEVDGDDMAAVREWLVRVARRMPRDPEDGLPDAPLLIRADENAPFDILQRLMELCGLPGIQITIIELGVAEDETSED